ncbi:GNAT family protein [Longimicrobium sp.]|uniref:GNAT family N-acetyltransferase n=1 Tax=Longimicrobium sp. TaxID=2029185 RepID=UPI002E34CDE1|nr:GNAT family protein [Longimicrobium sp.]HEX6039283.1 GNAT family protein [Longimicrobium sp.]
MDALQTGRITFIRSPRADDAAEWIELVRASRRFHAPWISAASTPEAFEAFLRRNEAAEFEAFVICRRHDGAIVGSTNLSQIFMGPFRSAYMGYWAGAPYAGQGYMTEGVGLVLTHAFRAMGLHRVEANLQPENAASRALVQRLGFTQEGYSPRYLKIAGRWRDHERWAILSENWRPSRARRASAK